MKRITLTTILLLIVESISAQITFKGAPFTRINIESNAKVTIKQDSVCTVIYSEKDKLAMQDLTIKNNTLSIDGIPLEEIIVTLPMLSEIDIDGNGSVNGESNFNVDDLKLKIDGNGKINMRVNAKKIDATIDGYGKITLAGTAQEANFSIPGSGKIDAIDLKTIRCNATIEGLGKCTVDAIDELNTNISGTGTVTYKTVPKKLHENVTGLGNTKVDNGDYEMVNTKPDTTRLTFGDSQLWVIGKKDTVHVRRHQTKPLWRGFEMGYNTWVDNNFSFTLSPGKENFDLRVEKSNSVGLNVLQTQKEFGNSNTWIFTGLGITWNNYRFESNVVLDNSTTFTTAHVDTTQGVNHLKSKLVAVYLTAPVMVEVFTSHKFKNAFHLGVGGMLGLRIGSHTKQKIEVDGDVSKLKDFDDFNLNPFRYGFRVAIGYGRFNVFADYYASTVFKDNKGPVLYPVNIGITLLGI